MRLRYIFNDIEKIFDEPREAVVFGRRRHGVHVDIDLTPDLSVSRPHARIWHEDGRYWVEDLGSANGTTIDDKPITPRTKFELLPGQTVGISHTRITVEVPAAAGLPHGLWGQDETIAAGRHDLVSLTEIGGMIDAAAPAFDAAHPIDAARARQMAALCELPLRFDAQADLESLLQAMVEEFLAMMPNASRGAMLLTDQANGDLLLKAHLPAGEPSVSLSLAHRAMAERQGFIWRGGIAAGEGTVGRRVAEGIYVPLLANERVLGVVCIDNGGGEATFAEADLRVMLAVAHQAAAAAAHSQMQETARRNTTLLNRLLTNFSPKIRAQLLERGRRGRLRVGGERSEVVLIFSDIRGFTRLTAGMDADDVVDLLNDYFSGLIEALFKYDGTVDKFIGDAILAVFGSPEPDRMRHTKAIHAALAMQAAARAVTAERRRRGQVVCELGIGVHCGEVLHGFIGSSDRVELTVIGDAVNWTSRYCDGAGAGEILISPEMHQRTWRFIDSELTSIASKHEGVLPAYRLRGVHDGKHDPAARSDPAPGH